MPLPDEALLQEAQQHVKNIFTTRVNNKFVFHNLEHTRDVVRCCQLIAGNYEIPQPQYFALLLAAWFHDTGYAAGSAAQHEEQSQKIATTFLREKNIGQDIIDAVNGCIMATKMPQSPTTLIEQIICDADLFHLGAVNFEEKNKLLRQEINQLQDEPIGKKEWRQLNIEFLQRHRYFTEFCRETLEPVKQRHLENLTGKLGKKEKANALENEPADMMIKSIDLEPTPEPQKEVENDKASKEKPLKEKDKQGRTERGVVAMFRIMSETHVSLSQMADSKANIMISVNTIVLSIMVSLLLGKLQFYPEYIFPTVILVAVCLSAVVFAILATRPNISGGTFSKEDIQNKQINLLFFGNFYNVPLPDYEWAMKEMMNDKEYLFGSMIKDIYFLGVVLARKYKFLRISYNIFMFGLIAAIIAFGVAFFFSDQNSAQ